MKQAVWEELVSSLATKPVSLEQIYDGVTSYFSVDRSIRGLYASPWWCEPTPNEKAKIRQVLQVLVSRRQMARDLAGRYQSTLSCQRCGEPSSDGHRSCETHLENHRRNWRRYQEERVAKRKCITSGCSNPPRIKTVASGRRGNKTHELRCPGCASRNAELCRAWAERRSCS